MIVKCSDIIADPQDNTSRSESNRMNPQDCMDLAKSIQVQGQLQPVLVKQEGDKYRLSAGFRRFTAISIILGWEEIEVKVVSDDLDASKLNMVENIQRRDLTFWEECCMLRENYPEGIVLKVIQDELGMSKTWVNTRWKAYNLPEEVKQQIEAGLLGFSDVLMLVKKGVDAERAAEKLLLAKAAGRTSESMQKEILNRNMLRGKKTIQRVMTKCLDRGFTPAVHALRFATGEIEEQTLMNYLTRDTNCTIVE